jgi:hypothetical protein
MNTFVHVIGNIGSEPKVTRWQLGQWQDGRPILIVRGC